HDHRLPKGPGAFRLSYGHRHGPPTRAGRVPGGFPMRQYPSDIAFTPAVKTVQAAKGYGPVTPHPRTGGATDATTGPRAGTFVRLMRSTPGGDVPFQGCHNPQGGPRWCESRSIRRCRYDSGYSGLSSHTAALTERGKPDSRARFRHADPGRRGHPEG